MAWECYIRHRIISDSTGVTLGSFKFINLFETLLAMATGMSLLLLFTFIEKVPRPMFDLSLFKIRILTGGNIAIFLNALARWAFTLVMSFYLQGPSMKLNALNAGIYLIPVSIALAAFAPLSGWLYDKYKLRMSAALGLLISSIGFFLLIRIGTTTSFYQIVLPLFLVGAGMGIFASPNRAPQDLTVYRLAFRMQTRITQTTSLEGLHHLKKRKRQPC